MFDERPDLGKNDFSGKEDSFSEQFLAKPIQRQYQPFGGPRPQPSQPQYEQEPLPEYGYEVQPGQYEIPFSQEADMYDQAKKQYAYIKSDASALNSSASFSEGRYKEFFDNKFLPFYKELDPYGDFDNDEDFVNSLDSLYEAELKASKGGDELAKSNLGKYFKWNQPNGLRDQFLRFKQERDERRLVADQYRAQEIALRDQLTNIPPHTRVALDEAKQKKALKPRSKKQTDDMLNQMRFEDALPDMLTGEVPNLHKTDPRKDPAPLPDMLTGEKSSASKEQQNRLAAAIHGDVKGFMSRRETVARDRRLRDKGFMFSNNGMVDGRPIGLPRSDVDLLDIDEMRSLGIKQYKGVPIEEAFQKLGGEERLNVAKILQAVRQAFNNSEDSQIEYLAAGRTPELKNKMESDRAVLAKTMQLAAEYGLTDEMIEYNESKNFFVRLYENSKNAIARGFNMFQQSRYSEDMLTGTLSDSEMADLLEYVEEGQNIPTGSALKKFHAYQSKDLWDAAGNLLFDNPEAMPELLFESLSAFLPSYLRTAPATIGTTTATGAAMGLAGGPLAPATVTSGALAGVKVGARINYGIAEAALEYSGVIIESMQELGIDYKNPKVFAAAWANEEIRDAIKTKAAKKSVPIALTGAAGGLLAGRVTAGLHHVGKSLKGGKLIDAAQWKRSQLTAPRFTRFQRVRNIGTELAVGDVALGGLGEYLGQLWSKDPGERIDYNSVAAEMMVGLGPGAFGAGVEMFRGKPDVSNVPTIIRGLTDTGVGTTGIIDLAGYRNEFNTFRDYRAAAQHIVDQGQFANDAKKQEALKIFTDVLARFHAADSDKASKLKLVFANRTPMADSKQEGSFHEWEKNPDLAQDEHELAIFINRKAISGNPLGVFLHEGGHFARVAMGIDQKQLVREYYDKLTEEQRLDAMTQYVVKQPDASYAKLDPESAEKKQVDALMSGPQSMSKEARADEWFSYQFVRVLTGRTVDAASPNLKKDLQNHLRTNIYPLVEKYVGGMNLGGSTVDNRLELDRKILEFMGYTPQGVIRDGKEVGLSFGEYQHERPGMKQFFADGKNVIDQMGDEEALNHLMKGVISIRETLGDKEAKKVVGLINALLDEQILPTEMSAYTSEEIEEIRAPMVEDEVSVATQVSTAERYEKLKGADAQEAVSKLVEVEKTQAKEGSKEKPKPILDKEGKVIPKTEPTPTGTRKIGISAKDVERKRDQTVGSINQDQILMPAAEVQEKDKKFLLKTRQPGTREPTGFRLFDTKEEAEKAKKEFYEDEIKKLKDTSEKVSDLKKLVLNEKEFEKAAAKIKTKLAEESPIRRDSENDLSFGEIIAEMMDLKGLQASAIFSESMVGKRFTDIAGSKAPDPGKIQELFIEHEKRVISAVARIESRVSDLQKRREFIKIENQVLRGEITKDAAIEAARSLGSSTKAKKTARWTVVWKSKTGTWKHWDSEKEKFVDGPNLDDIFKKSRAEKDPKRRLIRDPKNKDERLDPKIYNFVKKDKASADAKLNDKQKGFVYFWRRDDAKSSGTTAKKTQTQKQGKQPEPQKQEAEKKKKKISDADKKRISENEAEIKEIGSKLGMLGNYLDAIQPERAAIDWKDTPHFLYHKYVGEMSEEGKMVFKDENFERFTLGQLADGSSLESGIWRKAGTNKYEKVKGVSDTQNYLYLHTNWRLNLDQQKAEGQKPKPKAEGQKPKAEGRKNTSGVTKIISGGQNGADQAGLWAGKNLGIETGGTAPKGFETWGDKDESERLKKWGLTEVTDEQTKAYKKGNKKWGPRTELNVINSDGTVLFGNEKSEGSKLTIYHAKDHNKPYLINPTAEELRAWLTENDIKTLNVAGNRHSPDNGVFKKAKDTLTEALSGEPVTQKTKAEEAEESNLFDFETGKPIEPKAETGSSPAKNPDKSQAFNPFWRGRKLTDKLEWFGNKTVQEYLNILDAVRASAAMPENVGDKQLGRPAISGGKEVGQKDRIYFQSKKGTPVAAMMLFRLKEMDRQAGFQGREIVNGDLDTVNLEELTVYELATGRALEILDDREFRGNKQQRYHQVIERRAVEMAADIEAYEELLEKATDPEEISRITRILDGYEADIEPAGLKGSTEPGKDVKGDRVRGLRQQLEALIFDYDELGAFQGEETAGLNPEIHSGKTWTTSLTEFIYYQEKAKVIQQITDMWEKQIAEGAGPGMGRKPEKLSREPRRATDTRAWQESGAAAVVKALKKGKATRSQLAKALLKFKKLRDEAREKFDEEYAERAMKEGTDAAKEWGAETVTPDEYEFFGQGEKATSKVNATSSHESFARGRADEGIPVLALYAKDRSSEFNPNRTTFGTGSGSEQMDLSIAEELDRQIKEELEKRVAAFTKENESQDIDTFEIEKPGGGKLKVKRVSGVWKKANNHKLNKDLSELAEQAYVRGRIEEIIHELESADSEATAGVTSGAHVSAVQFVDYLLNQVKGGGSLKKAVLSLEWTPSSKAEGKTSEGKGRLNQLPGGPAGGLLPYVWFDFISEIYKKLGIKQELELTKAKDPNKSGWQNTAGEMTRTVEGKRVSEENTLYQNGVPDVDTMVKMIKPVIQAVYNAGRVRLNLGRGFDEEESSASSPNASNILQRDPLMHENPRDAIMEYAPEGSMDNQETEAELKSGKVDASKIEEEEGLTDQEETENFRQSNKEFETEEIPFNLGKPRRTGAADKLLKEKARKERESGEKAAPVEDPALAARGPLTYDGKPAPEKQKEVKLSPYAERLVRRQQEREQVLNFSDLPPIPEGHVRLIHQTSENLIDKIKKDGLEWKHNIGTTAHVLSSMDHLKDFTDKDGNLKTFTAGGNTMNLAIMDVPEDVYDRAARPKRYANEDGSFEIDGVIDGKYFVAKASGKNVLGTEPKDEGPRSLGSSVLMGDKNLLAKISKKFANTPIHLSRGKKITPRDYEQSDFREDTWGKPDGLWFSRGSGWADWLNSEYPARGETSRYAHKLDIKSDRLLKIDKNNIDEFNGKYVESVRFGENFSQDKVDWRKVAKDWGGVEVDYDSLVETDPASGLRYLPKHDWLRGWDLNAGVVWSKDAINSVKLIAKSDSKADPAASIGRDATLGFNAGPRSLGSSYDPTLQLGRSEIFKAADEIKRIARVSDIEEIHKLEKGKQTAKGGISASEALDILIRMGSPLEKALAERLKKIPFIQDIRVGYAKAEGTRRATYHYNEFYRDVPGGIALHDYTKRPPDGSTLIHELMHAVTVPESGNFTKERGRKPKFADKNMQELYDVWQQARRAWQDKSRRPKVFSDGTKRGGKDVFTALVEFDEFLAEIYTNVDLQSWMATIEYEYQPSYAKANKSLFDEILDILAKILDFNPEGRTLLEDSLVAMDRFVESKRQEPKDEGPRSLGSTYSLSSHAPEVDLNERVSLLARMASSDRAKDWKDLWDNIKSKLPSLKAEGIASFVNLADPSSRVIEKFVREAGIKEQELLDRLDIRGLWHQYYGKTDEVVKQAQLKFIEPIEDALREHGVSLEDFGQYLIARAAPSRNIRLKNMYKEELAGATKESDIELLTKLLEKHGDNLSGVSTEDAIKVVKDMETGTTEELKRFQNFLQDSSNPLQLFYDMNLEGLRFKSESGLIRSTQDDKPGNSSDIDEYDAMVKASSFFDWSKNGSKYMYQKDGENSNYSYAPMQGFKGEDDGRLFDRESAYQVAGKSQTSAGQGWDQPKHKFIQEGAFGRLNKSGESKTTITDSEGNKQAVGPDPKITFMTAQEQYFDGAIRSHKNEVSQAYGLAFEIIRAVAYPNENLETMEGFPPFELKTEMPDLWNRMQKDETISQKAREMFEGENAVFEKEFRPLKEKQDYQIETKDIEVDGKKVDGLSMVRRSIDTTFQNASDVFVYRKNGVAHMIKFKSNERGARVARSLKNLRYEPLPKVLQAPNSIVRFMASMFTSKNPLFWFPNLSRDLGSMLVHLTEDEKSKLVKDAFNPKTLAGHWKGVIKNELSVKRGKVTEIGSGNLTKEYAQELLARGDHAEMYQFMKQAGGKVGYFRHKPVVELIEEFKTSAKKMSKSKSAAKKGWKALWDYVDVGSSAFENSVRMAAFWAAIKNGYTVHQAANISRNISVDFNQKGELSQILGSQFVFFSAGVNSADRMIQTFKRRGVKGSSIFVAKLAGASFLLASLNRLMDDEDEDKVTTDFDTLSSYKRDTNAVVQLPDGNGSVTIPIPLGYNAIWALGNTLADSFWDTMSDGDTITSAEFMSRNGSAVMNAFNPIGGASVSNILTPSWAKPFQEVFVTEEDFLGRPNLKPNLPFEAPKPTHMRAQERDHQYLIDADRELNEWMGGNDQVTGSWAGLFGGDASKSRDGKKTLSLMEMEQLFTGYTGGLGQLFSGIFGEGVYPLVSDTKEFEEFEPNKVPLMNRFYRTTTHDSYARQRYYHTRTAVKTAEAELKAAGKNKALAKQISIDRRDLLSLSGSVKYVDGLRSKIRAEKKKIESSKLSPERKMQRIAELEAKEHDALRTVIKKAQKRDIV